MALADCLAWCSALMGVWKDRFHARCCRRRSASMECIVANSHEALGAKQAEMDIRRSLVAPQTEYKTSIRKGFYHTLSKPSKWGCYKQSAPHFGLARCAICAMCAVVTCSCLHYLTTCNNLHEDIINILTQNLHHIRIVVFNFFPPATHYSNPLLPNDPHIKIE